MKIERKLNYTNIYTIMFLLMSAVFTILIIFFVSFNHVNVQKIENQIVSSLEIKYKQELTEGFYSHFESFLAYIYKNENFITYLNNQTENDKNTIIELFKSMAGSNKEVTQLRYINESGKEIIRVNRDNLGEDIYFVEQKKLQDKKNRYYFIDTMKKDDGGLYISNLDLNVENDEIMLPYTPVLRFAIPVYANAEPKGILIVNVFAQKLLSKLLHSPQFNVDIYDQDKQILVSSLNNNWSRYLQTTPNFKSEAFITTQRLIQAKSGESLFIGLTPKPQYDHYYSYFNKYMFILIVFMIIISIVAAMFLAKIPQKLLRKLAIKDKTIDKNIILSTTDENGIITDVSEAFCKYSGYSKKELIGKNHNILRHPDTSKEVFENLWTTIKSQKVWHDQMQTMLKDNRQCWIDIKIMPEYDENTKLLGYISIRQDITDQKENISLLEENSRLLQMETESLLMENETLIDNEQQLLSALEDFEIISNNISTAYIVIRYDLQVKFWNQTAEKIFGLKRLLKVEIRPLGILADNFSHIDFVNYLKDAKYKDNPYSIEMRMDDKSLKPFSVHVIEHPTCKNTYILSFNSL